MKIKIQAYTPFNTGEEPHVPGEIINLRDSVAKEWIKNKWAIALPDEEEEKTSRAKEQKAEVVEAPEDSLPKHETASLKRKKK